jgi:4-amino-4-deoxy-L-arabinose transferase-like glycosyltransferase
VRKLLKKHWPWFLAVTTAGILLRLYFVLKLPTIAGDTLVYGEIAKCILRNHMFGLEKSIGWRPTLIRLPGYPFFLAFSFLLSGVDRYFGAMLLQLVFDVLTCFLVADIARRIFSDGAARTAFLIAAFCPFLMSYVSTPLTECLEVFFTAAALDCALIAFGKRGAWRWWAVCGAAVAGAILLRPDGGLLLGCIGLAVLLIAWRESDRRRELIAATLLLGAVSLSPLVPWAIRNYRVFHVFQPLVTTTASDPGENDPQGFGRWYDTWAFDYAHTVDLSFNVSGEPIRIEDVPNYAFDSPEQRIAVKALFDKYNATLDITPDVDQQFTALARQNVRRHPIRYYVLLPVARTLDMWFRPRTEMLPLDTHFWQIRQDPHDSLISIALGVLNLLYLGCAVAGAWLLRRRLWPFALLLVYPVVRSLFLATTFASEDRYTMECFPAIFVLAAGFVTFWWERRRSAGNPA